MAALVIILTVVFVLSCLAITFLVLIQPPHSDGGSGLAGAFMGAGGDSFFGTKAMTMAGKMTMFLSILIVALAITINKMDKKKTGPTGGSLLHGSVPEGTPGGGTPPAEDPNK
jgi:protein translocase SecG subunit